MKAERRQQVERLYHAALECEPESRAAFLDEACAGDAELRGEVESLLKYESRANSFIEAPALEVAAEMMAEERLPSWRATRLLTTRFSPRLAQAGWAKSTWLRTRGSGARSHSSYCLPSSRKTKNVCAASSRKRVPLRRLTIRTSHISTKSQRRTVQALSRWSMSKGKRLMPRSAVVRSTQPRWLTSPFLSRRGALRDGHGAAAFLRGECG